MHPRLTFANVVSVLALFIALGGASYAALKLPKNSVSSKQLKKNAVTTAKIKNEAVTAAKVKKGTLTGAQINAATLGAVPNAGHAGSADSAAAAATSGTASIASSLAPPEAWHEVGRPGEPELQHGCKAIPERIPRFFKDHEGVVHVEGIYEACSSEGETAFQLPPGFRPGTLLQFPLIGHEGNIAIFPTISGVPQISGAVKCGGNQCTLDGVTFRAES